MPFLEAASRRVAVALCALAVLGAPTAAQSQDYPARAIKMVVPFPPGGGFDALARPFAERLAAELGQVIVVDNRPGAAGNIGAGSAAHAPADGYTLLFANDFLGTNPNLSKKINYDPAKDFVPIAQVAVVALGIAVHPGIAAKTFPELVALSKGRALSYGTPGIGTSPHLMTELLGFTAGVRVSHIPYRGTAPAITDALGGQLDMVVVPVSALAPYVKSGKLKGIAVASAQPSAMMPDVPTLAEQGTAVSHDVWYGLFAPKGTPEAAVKRLREASARVLAQPDFATRLTGMGFELQPSTPRAIGERIAADLAKWHAVVERAGITAD